MARRVRPDQRWDAGVGAGGGKVGSNAWKRRSLAVDQPVVSNTVYVLVADSYCKLF
jgi:hypothetical protein